MEQKNYEEISPATTDVTVKSQQDLLKLSKATDLMLASLDKVSTLSSDFDDMVHTLSVMHVAVKQIDAELEAYRTATGAKLDKFRLQVPLLDKQMDNISNRIDKITDKILGITDGDVSDQTLKKQSILMDALHDFNDSFNNLVMKLMEF